MLVSVLRCSVCGQKMGQMHLRALNGGKVTIVRRFILARTTFVCATCAAKTSQVEEARSS